MECHKSGKHQENTYQIRNSTVPGSKLDSDFLIMLRIFVTSFSPSR